MSSLPRPLRGSRRCSPLRLDLLRTLLAALGLLIALTAMAEGKSRDRGRKGRAREVEREPKSPPSLALEQLDLPAARAVVIVGGAIKAPDARLFVFHADPERHFVALFAACDDVGKAEESEPAEPPVPEPPESIAARKVPDPSMPASDPPPPPASDPRSAAPTPPLTFPVAIPEGALRCRLDVPRPYLRAHVISLTLRMRGKEVSVEAPIFEAAWVSAQKAARLPSTPPAVPMTSVQYPCEDPGFVAPPPGDAQAPPNATDEEEVEESEDETAD